MKITIPPSQPDEPQKKAPSSRVKGEIPLVPVGDKSPPGVPYIKVVAADYDYWLDAYEELRQNVVDLQNKLIRLTADRR